MCLILSPRQITRSMFNNFKYHAVPIILIYLYCSCYLCANAVFILWLHHVLVYVFFLVLLRDFFYAQFVVVAIDCVGYYEHLNDIIQNIHIASSLTKTGVVLFSLHHHDDVAMWCATNRAHFSRVVSHLKKYFSILRKSIILIYCF